MKPYVDDKERETLKCFKCGEPYSEEDTYCNFCYSSLKSNYGYWRSGPRVKLTPAYLDYLKSRKKQIVAFSLGWMGFPLMIAAILLGTLGMIQFSAKSLPNFLDHPSSVELIGIENTRPNITELPVPLSVKDELRNQVSKGKKYLLGSFLLVVGGIVLTALHFLVGPIFLLAAAFLQLISQFPGVWVNTALAGLAVYVLLRMVYFKIFKRPV